MKQLRINPQAKAEFHRHLSYYGAHALTLTTAEDFRREIDTALSAILARPNTYRVINEERQIRRFGPTEKFRFVLYYMVRKNEIYVFAFVHPARKPDYWLDRRE